MNKFRALLFGLGLLLAASVASATTTTLTLYPTAEPAAQTVLAGKNGPVAPLKYVLNFADNNVSSLTVAKAFYLPPGTTVLSVGLKCDTAEGETCTINVGDAADADGYIAGANVNSTDTRVQSLGGTTAYNTAKAYTAAGYVRVTAAGNTANVGKVTLTIWAIQP